MFSARRINSQTNSYFDDANLIQEYSFILSLTQINHAVAEEMIIYG
jgi:hypothetical protein